MRSSQRHNPDPWSLRLIKYPTQQLGLLTRGWGPAGTEGLALGVTGGKGRGRNWPVCPCPSHCEGPQPSLLQVRMLSASLKPLLMQGECGRCSYSPDKPLRLRRASEPTWPLCSSNSFESLRPSADACIPPGTRSSLIPRQPTVSFLWCFTKVLIM